MDTFTVLAEPTRRSIIEIVARRGELTATEIGEKFHASPPAISQHLKVLRDAGVLRMKKRGRQRIYRLNVAAIDEIDRWVRQTREVWDSRLDRLGNAVSKKDKK
jgi:DNA-binding transcriptional ArsR family regulator